MLIINRIILVSAFLGLLVGCGGGSKPDTPGNGNGSNSGSSSGTTIDQPKLEISDFIENTNEWVVTIESNVAWRIEAEDWVEVSQTSGSGDQQVTLTIDRENAPAGDITAILEVHAEDISGLTTSYQLHADNGITINPSILSLNKVWGAETTSEIQIYTFLDWTISTDLPGITFTPESGSGSQ